MTSPENSQGLGKGLVAVAVIAALGATTYFLMNPGKPVETKGPPNAPPANTQPAEPATSPAPEETSAAPVGEETKVGNAAPESEAEGDKGR